MNRSRIIIAGILACAVSACGEPDPPDASACKGLLYAGPDCPGGTGTLELHFAVGPKVRESALLVDPLEGTAHGDLFRPEHVNPSGPTPDAVSTGAVRVDHVDFTGSIDAGDESTESFTATVCAGSYVFLGLLDVDGNAADPALGDKGDPVTSPSGAKTRQFEVKENEHTKQTILFDLALMCDVTCINPPTCVL